MVDETFALQVDKCSMLLENALSLYSEAGQTAGQVKSIAKANILANKAFANFTKLHNRRGDLC